jgi:hypothetical protein
MTAAPLAVALRYDYASLGTAGDDIRRHVLAFKAAEKRMAENTIAAGIELIAIKETIPHGHWLPLLNNELGIGEDAAQVMMNVARRFGSNTETYRLLSPSVLALLAVKSVPDAAVDAVIAAAAVSPVTVTAAKGIIASHRPARCRKCGRTLTDPDAIRAGIGPCCAARMARDGVLGEAKAEAVQAEDRPLPAWVTDGETVAVPPDFAPVVAIANPALAPTVAPPQGDSGVVAVTGADGRLAALAALAARLEELREEVREVGDEYGRLVGNHDLPREVRRGIERMQVQVQREQGEGWGD